MENRQIDIEQFIQACIELELEIRRHNDNCKFSNKKYRYFKDEIKLLPIEYK